MPETRDTRAYWKANLRLLSDLVVVRRVVSYGFGILGLSLALHVPGLRRYALSHARR